MTQRTVRPGRVIKSYLENNGQASQSDLHFEYTAQVLAENDERKAQGLNPLSKMAYSSFRTLVTRARLSGLLEKVGESPYTGKSPLVGVRDGEVVESYQVVLALTGAGASEVAGWDNLQAYHDSVRGG